MSPQYAIPRGSKILVTGANGYIGSHVVDILLELGFNVRGTVRSEKPWLDNLFKNKYGKDRFESIIVPKMESDGAFDEALKDVAGVIHVASDLSLSPDPNVVIPATVKGILNILKSASTHSSIKRLVLTSSSSAALIPQPNKAGVIVDEDTWNDAAIEAAWSESTPLAQRPFFVYAASKTQGEKEAWKWIGEAKPNFVFNTVLPNINFGEILSPEIPGSTMGLTRKLLQGDQLAINLFPPQYYVDVRDTARLHTIALLDPTVEAERIFAFAAAQNWTDVIGILRKLRPNNKNIPDPPANEGRDLSEIRRQGRAEQLLRSFFDVPGWTGLEESLAAGIEGLE